MQPELLKLARVATGIPEVPETMKGWGGMCFELWREFYVGDVEGSPHDGIGWRTLMPHLYHAPPTGVARLMPRL